MPTWTSKYFCLFVCFPNAERWKRAMISLVQAGLSLKTLAPLPPSSSIPGSGPYRQGEQPPCLEDHPSLLTSGAGHRAPETHSHWLFQTHNRCLLWISDTQISSTPAIALLLFYRCIPKTREMESKITMSLVQYPDTWPLWWSSSTRAPQLSLKPSSLQWMSLEVGAREHRWDRWGRNFLDGRKCFIYSGEAGQIAYMC